MSKAESEGGAPPLTPDHRRDAADAWKRASEAAQRFAVTALMRVSATEERNDALNLLLAHDMIAYREALDGAIRDAQTSMHCALLDERQPHPYSLALASKASAADPQEDPQP